MKSNFPEKVKGYTLEKLSGKPLKEFAKLCNKVACEGLVMLKNDNDTLPLKKNSTVSVFGRIQERYYGMGTGSGGGVRPLYKTDILSSLRSRNDIKVNEELAKIYADWVAENPYDDKAGAWIQPFAQEEMPLTDEIVRNAKAVSDTAIIIIGRTAGEDRDSKAERGAYYLSELEEEMIKKVSAVFDKVCVYLNVGLVMDMSWVEKYNPSAVVYGWQAGQEGGDAAVKVFMGDANPCGKLSDTIAYTIDDYPSNANFGNQNINFYEEDIYVGYRYFETFAKDRVMYPFGFGLSYTSFEIKATKIVPEDKYIEFTFAVKNTGNVAGKEVVQVYLNAPQGKLGKPAVALVGYAKTNTIAPGKTAYVKVDVPFSYLTSYDDGGKTGYKSAYVLEEGVYNFLAGNSCRNIEKVYSLYVGNTVCVEQLRQACAPTMKLKRMIPQETENGFEIAYEDVPQREYHILDRIEAELPEEISYTGDKGLKLLDVAEGRCTLEEFIAQLSDFDLCCLCRGEGMQSPKVDVDTASVFGGVTKQLLGFGIPLALTNDGPCGIRDLVKKANTTSMPNGTCIACTFNDLLIEELLVFEAMELYNHKLDTLLGPGINIHRHPLNGRNFEYFSEDPLLAGKMAAAQCRGAWACGKSLTVKHMACNNQETNRHGVDAEISERALREIYLRPFELAIKEGGCDTIMTSYNPINGIWSASNYDMNTVIVREQWGFDGFIMTDWWPKCNLVEGRKQSATKFAEMVISQNDVFMLYDDPKNARDNANESLANGFLKRSQLQRNAKNILNFILHTKSFENFIKYGYTDPTEMMERIETLNTYAIIDEPFNGVCERPVVIDKGGVYVMKITYRANYHELEQHFMWFRFNRTNGNGCALLNTNGKLSTKTFIVSIPDECKFLSIDTLVDSITVEKIEFLKD